MRVFYYLSSYIRHLNAGLDYIECLRVLGHQVSCNLYDLAVSENAPLLEGREHGCCADYESSAREAELVILHEDVLLLPGIFKRMPFLRGKKTVVILPWETESLPESYVEPLRLADTIWTASEFAGKSVRRYFDNARVLPHVVRRIPASPEDLAWAEQFRGEYTFLHVADIRNPRKNIMALTVAFNQLCKTGKKDVRLLIKQYQSRVNLGAQRGVTSITDLLPPGRMGALFEVCDAYVSPHRMEGWGLSLSTAMAHGKYAIATGYSGNMEYMDRENSVLLGCELTPVPDLVIQAVPFYSPGMHWAEVDRTALHEAMRDASTGALDPMIPERAAKIIETYGTERIAARMDGLIAELFNN